MGSKRFQEARGFVEQAVASNDEEDIAKAKNSLSSAFANSPLATKKQLSQMQDELSQIDSK
jgi:hypothetical protein